MIVILICNKLCSSVLFNIRLSRLLLRHFKWAKSNAHTFRVNGVITTSLPIDFVYITKYKIHCISHLKLAINYNVMSLTQIVKNITTWLLLMVANVQLNMEVNLHILRVGICTHKFWFRYILCFQNDVFDITL